MIERECYECGRVVELPDDCFLWVCQCGYDQRTRERESVLRERYAGDRLLRFFLDEVLEDSPIRDAETGDEERAMAEALARRMEAVEARLERARGTFLRPARPRLSEALDAVRGASDGAGAWNALIARGLLPETFRDVPRRRFLAGGELLPAPPEVETAVALAADLPAALEVEERFVDLCRALGAAPTVIWDDLAGDDRELFSISALTAIAKRNRWRELWCAPDADAAVLAAELDDGEASPFALVAAIHAAGYSVSAYAEDDGSDLLVLRAGPVDLG